MMVLGRLVDYTGLWERDLYFVLLTLIYEQKSQPKDWFTEDRDKKRLQKNQIVDILRGLGGKEASPEKQKHGAAIKEIIGETFGIETWKGGKGKKIRTRQRTEQYCTFQYVAYEGHKSYARN